MSVKPKGRRLPLRPESQLRHTLWHPTLSVGLKMGPRISGVLQFSSSSLLRDYVYSMLAATTFCQRFSLSFAGI